MIYFLSPVAWIAPILQCKNIPSNAALFSEAVLLVARQITTRNMERTFAFETHLKLSELAKLDTNETKFISPTELVCNLYLLMREDLHSMYDELSN